MAQEFAIKIISCIQRKENCFETLHTFLVNNSLNVNHKHAFEDVIVPFLRQMTYFFRGYMPWTIQYESCSQPTRYGDFVQLQWPSSLGDTLMFDDLLRDALDDDLDQQSNENNETKENIITFGSCAIIYIDRTNFNQTEIASSEHIFLGKKPYQLKAVLCKDKNGEFDVISPLNNDYFSTEIQKKAADIIAWMYEDTEEELKEFGLGRPEKSLDYMFNALSFLLISQDIAKKLNECQGKNLLELEDEKTSKKCGLDDLSRLSWVKTNLDNNTIILRGLIGAQDVHVKLSLSGNIYDNACGVESNIYALDISSEHIAKAISTGFCKESEAFAKLDDKSVKAQIFQEWGRLTRQNQYANYMFYVILPTVSGKVLSSYTDLTQTECDSIMVQMTQLLCALETKQIMHHDLHLDNVFLERLSSQTTFKYSCPFRFEHKSQVKITVLDFDRAYCGTCLLNRNTKLDSVGMCRTLHLCNEFVPKFDWFTFLYQFVSRFPNFKPFVMTISKPATQVVNNNDRKRFPCSCSRSIGNKCLTDCAVDEDRLTLTLGPLEYLTKKVKRLPDEPIKSMYLSICDQNKLKLQELTLGDLKSGSASSCVIEATYEKKPVWLRLLISKHQHFLAKFMMDQKIGSNHIFYPSEFGQVETSSIATLLKNLSIEPQTPTLYYQIIQQPQNSKDRFIDNLKSFCGKVNAMYAGDDKWAWDMCFQVAQVLQEFEQRGIMHNHLNAETVMVEYMERAPIISTNYRDFMCHSELCIKILGFDYSSCEKCLFDGKTPPEQILSEDCAKTGQCVKFRKNLDFARFVASLLSNIQADVSLKKEFPNLVGAVQVGPDSMFGCTCTFPVCTKCDIDQKILDSVMTPQQFIEKYVKKFPEACREKKNKGVSFKTENVEVNEEPERDPPCKVKMCNALTKKGSRCRNCVSGNNNTCSKHM